MPSNNPQNQAPRERHRLDFFRPDQITLLVTHLADVEGRIEDGRLLPKILEEWSIGLSEQLGGQFWRLKVGSSIRSYSFPALGQRMPVDLPESYQKDQYEDTPFSILVCNVESIPPQDRMNLTSSLNQSETQEESYSDPAECEEEDKHDQDDKEDKEDKEGKEEKRAGGKRQLLNLILELDDNHEQLSSAGLNVQGVFPNWIISGSASDSGGTGGPGGPPSPYTDSLEPAPADFYFESLISKLKGQNSGDMELYGDGTGVDVIILDTAPPAQDLVLAHKELVLLKDPGKKHRLLEYLLGPGGKLKLYPATYDEQLRMGNTSLNQHGYKMADHGLFIAGIIHSIVPNATIHLIEILNQFGAGDLETIASGLDKAYEICRQTSGKAVINGSWCLDLPDILEHFRYTPTDEEEVPDIEMAMEGELRDKMNLELANLSMETGKDIKALRNDLHWVAALRMACERLAWFGRQVVAAAGNQGKDAGQSRVAPSARYPAALSKVVGVGALPKNAERPDGKFNASSFSNLGDNPENIGIMALGGEPGERNGVLGIYLGEFPPEDTATDQEADPEVARRGNGQGWDRTGPRCTNGWAWWAGTSFATPVITGAIASVLSGPQNPGTTQSALSLLYTACIIINARTEINEDVIPSSLTQAPPPPNWPLVI